MERKEQTHPFDTATQLTEEDGISYGHTSEHYANMVGPFGGITAAVLLGAIMEHPERIGEPVALTINYAAPVAVGAFRISVTPARTNRSTQHWIMELRQEERTVITGTAVFANRRETWSATEAKFPKVPPAKEVESLPAAGLPPWVRSYDMKMIEGAPLALSEPAAPAAADSVTLQWMQDAPRRPLDFLSLAAMCDAFFPRIYVRREPMVPIGTVSLTIYFHADSHTLAEHGDREVLGHARALQFRSGFFDQTAELWTPDGKLLATTSQLVYYKE